jgi:type 1 glutamine amidotransferase
MRAMTAAITPTRTQARALVLINGDDVYEDLFIASIKLQEILVEAGFAARLVAGTDRLVMAAEADLVVLYTALGLFPPSRQEALADAVAAGTGLIAVHSASVFPRSPDGRVAGDHQVIAELIGCRFVSHGPDPHESRFTVGISSGHPVARGLAAFDVTHEHYQLELTAPGEVIAWREPAPCGPDVSEPVCYVRTVGTGRVCYLQLGHDMRVWDEPAVRQLIAGAAGWARRPFQPGGTR